jgi:hypothetical protein
MANGSDESQEPRNTSAQTPGFSETCSPNAPTANVTTSGGTAISSASTTLPSTYARGVSVVRRSVRFQPSPRSTAIWPPLPIAAFMAPNRPMLTIT